MVKEFQIDGLSIGSELINLSNQSYTYYWKRSIKNIRLEGFSGSLTYCSMFYPIETQNIAFWDELDFIGIDFYIPLLYTTHDDNIPSE